MNATPPVTQPGDDAEVDTEMVEKSIADLCALHERLLGCFTVPTGEPPLRRPRSFHPSMTDCFTILAGVISIEHLRSTRAALSSPPEAGVSEAMIEAGAAALESANDAFDDDATTFTAIYLAMREASAREGG